MQSDLDLIEAIIAREYPTQVPRAKQMVDILKRAGISTIHLKSESASHLVSLGLPIGVANRLAAVAEALS